MLYFYYLFEYVNPQSKISCSFLAIQHDFQIPFKWPTKWDPWAQLAQAGVLLIEVKTSLEHISFFMQCICIYAMHCIWHNVFGSQLLAEIWS